MNTNTVELLAPAGNAAALRAAVRAGADAVYMGLESFNARRGADNFTFETLGQACAYAHLRGVKVYVTLNTVVLPREVDEALECARQAFRAGADAFIVQDIGLASEIKRTLPEARLHISTQMNTHSEAGIRAAARLGAARVTLAREVSVPEIAHLAQVADELGLEVETFAHGALCICYSGQCFMSSMIGGRSANRGMCAQACRLPYTLHNVALPDKELPAPGEHLLSPQDLCSIDLLPQLIEAGARSLKIEGRMKSPEYVASVTALYRAALDRALAACDAGEPDAFSVSAAEHDALAATFSRGFTTAYLEGKRGNDIMSYQRPNNRGQFIGRVSSIEKGRALIETQHELEVGDVIEFWTKKGHVALTVSEDVQRRGRAVQVTLDGRTKSVRTGDRTFRVRSAAAAYHDDELEPRVPVVCRATLRKGAPLTIEFAVADPGDVAQTSVDRAVLRRLGRDRAQDALVASAEGPVVEQARTKAVTADDVRAHIDRLGSTPFRIVDMTVDLDEGVGIGFSQIHRCRAAALENLEERIVAGTVRRTLPRIAERDAVAAERPSSCVVAALATNPACARAAQRAGAQVVYVSALNLPRGEAMSAGQLSPTGERASYPADVVPSLPAIDHDAVGAAREAAVNLDVWAAVREGEPVVAESLASLQRAHEMGALVEAGPHVPVTNELALDALHAFGVRRVWLSPELNLHQIEDLGRATSIPLGITVSGTQELMVCEHCLLMSQGPCDQQCASCPRRKSPHFLEDRKGFAFPVATDTFGRSHLYNSVPLDIVPAIPDLLAAGVTAFLVDATLMNTDETTFAVERVARAVKVAQRDGNTLAKLPDTTSGHLYRGVQ